MRRGYHKQARTIRVKATDGSSGREKTDQGNYFRCWNCGFICDIRRDELSKDGRRGTVLTVYEGASQGGNATGDAANLSPGGGHDIVMMKSLADGTPATILRTYTVSGTGCPLCHSTAWKK